jgi:hypothetical protein
MGASDLLGKDFLETWLNIIRVYGGDEAGYLWGVVVKGLSGEPISENDYWKLYEFLSEHEDELEKNGIDTVVLLCDFEVGYEEEKGGAGSGYWRPHYGRPGLRGGSLPRGIGEDLLGGDRYIFVRERADRVNRFKKSDEGYRSKMMDNFKNVINGVKLIVMDKVGSDKDMVKRADKFFNWLVGFIEKLNEFDVAKDMYKELDKAYKKVIDPVKQDDLLVGYIYDGIQAVGNKLVREFLSSLRVDMKVGNVKVVNTDDETPVHLYKGGMRLLEFIKRVVNRFDYLRAGVHITELMRYSSDEFLDEDKKGSIIRYFQSDEFKGLMSRLPSDLKLVIYPANCSLFGAKGFYDIRSGVVMIGNDWMDATLSRVKEPEKFSEEGYRSVWVENILSHEAGHVWMRSLGLDFKKVAEEYKIRIEPDELLGAIYNYQSVPEVDASEGLAELFRCCVAGRFSSDVGVRDISIDRRPCYVETYVKPFYDPEKGWNKEITKVAITNLLKLDPEKIINPELRELLKWIKSRVIKFVIV